MSYRDLLKIEHPESLNRCWLGGCRGCPGHYWDGAPTLDQYEHDPSPLNCSKCWDSEVPASIPAPRVQFNINEMNKGEKEMEPRNISFSPTASMAENNPKKPSICENVSELRTILSDIYGKLDELDCLLFGGVPQETLSSMPSCLEEDIQMNKEKAVAIMKKLCSIQSKL